MKLIENPLKPVTVWLLGAATLIIALEALVPQLRGLLPEQWCAWIIPAALVARLVKQTFGGEPEPKPRVRVEERGWVPFYLLPWIALFAFVSLFLIACAPRPAGRDVCYAQAFANATLRYTKECEAHGGVEGCPAVPAIEAEQQTAQEACP